MFIFDFVASKIMEQIMNWFYSMILEFLGEFFAMMGNMGTELFDQSWVQSIVLLFKYFGWALFAVGLVVCVFETAIEYQGGRGSVKDAGLNIIKGFMAVTLFSTLPIELYKFSISLQSSMTSGMASLAGSETSVTASAIGSLNFVSNMGLSAVLGIFILIMMGYAIIKVFFANLKRGGILLIQMAVGSLYMFSVPRGYTDGFIQWCKQVIGICLTAFLQSVILIAGLGVMRNNLLLGIGLILAASEVPRIAGQFGMDTSTKTNLMSSMYAAQTAINLTKTIVAKGGA